VDSSFLCLQGLCQLSPDEVEQRTKGWGCQLTAQFVELYSPTPSPRLGIVCTSRACAQRADGVLMPVPTLSGTFALD